jgi:hypothetical protein
MAPPGVPELDHSVDRMQCARTFVSTAMAGAAGPRSAEAALPGAEWDGMDRKHDAAGTNQWAVLALPLARAG